MRVKTIYASTVAKLDSHVWYGGGTDDTLALQKVLDEAADENVGIHLIMDGAALVSGLNVYSNTTIECLSEMCGFFQKAHSNRAVITNYKGSFDKRLIHDVTLVGGTYNQDCHNQEHDVMTTDYLGTYSEVLESQNVESEDKKAVPHWIFGLEFYGVENLTIRDLKVRNFRTFAVTIGNFFRVNIDNVWLDLPDKMFAQNQDGFHFWGPGQFLTVRNVGGDVGDDFMNIGPDERDSCSSITDVLIDGVMLHHADQGIRLLSRGTGILDRVTIRNVTGTYRSFGFYINPWFPDKTYGDIRHVLFENIDLQPEAPVYTYRDPFLFCIGGNVEELILRDIYLRYPIDNRPLIEIGRAFYDIHWTYPEDNLPKIRSIRIENLFSRENTVDSAEMDYVRVYAPIDRLYLKDCLIERPKESIGKGNLLHLMNQGAIQRLYLENVETKGQGVFEEENTKIDKTITTGYVDLEG